MMDRLLHSDLFGIRQYEINTPSLTGLVSLVPATSSVETHLARQVGGLWVSHSVLDTVLKEAEGEASISTYLLAKLSWTCVVSLC